MNFANMADFARFTDERYQKILMLDSPQSALDVYCLLPGQSQRLHAHAGTDKYYVIWEGTATVQVGDEVRELGRGEAAICRADVPHGIANNSSEPVVAVVFRTLKPQA